MILLGFCVSSYNLTAILEAKKFSLVILCQNVHHVNGKKTDQICFCFFLIYGKKSQRPFLCTF